MNFFRNSTNKLLIASLLTTAIFAIGLLNFMSMNHSAQGHEACIPAIAQGADCSVPQGNEGVLRLSLGYNQ